MLIFAEEKIKKACKLPNMSIPWICRRGFCVALLLFSRFQLSVDPLLSSWLTDASTMPQMGNVETKTETMNTTTTPQKFYKMTRTGMATYDSVGY